MELNVDMLQDLPEESAGLAIGDCTRTCTWTCRITAFTLISA